MSYLGSSGNCPLFSPVSYAIDLFQQYQTSCPYHCCKPILTTRSFSLLSPGVHTHHVASLLPFSLAGHRSSLSFLTQARAWLYSLSPAIDTTVHLPQDFVLQFFSPDHLLPSCPRYFSRAILCPSQPCLLLSRQLLLLLMDLNLPYAPDGT